MAETQSSPLSAAAARMVSRCRQLAQISDTPGQTTRLFLSPATRDAHKLLLGWMHDAALETRVDDTGSLRAVLRSQVEDAPTLLLFSHIDTVPNAGAFDGPLGVLVGLAAIEELAKEPAALSFHIELIAFSEEEGVRFGFPFLSSLAATGQLTPAHLGRSDADGKTVAAAIGDFGLDSVAIPFTCPLPEKSFAALEIHLEQGPVLDTAGEALAVVQGIIGQSRLRLTFEGEANHAGTTPMPLRHDSLAAAAAWIVNVERFASTHDPLVATVGRLDVLPGASNVIPGRVVATLDVRHPDDLSRREAVAALQASAELAASTRGVRVHTGRLMEHPAVPMDAHLTAALRDAAQAAGYATRAMFSGAGHDAMILASHVPTAMLFVRTPGGISHDPRETARQDDTEAAIATTLQFIRSLRP